MAGPQAAANDANANYISLNHPYHQPIDSINDSQHLCLNLDSVSSLPTPPEKIEEFEARVDAEEWWQAARTELLDTYTLVPRPTDGTNVFKTRLRCSYKINPETGALYSTAKNTEYNGLHADILSGIGIQEGLLRDLHCHHEGRWNPHLRLYRRRA